MAATLVEGSTDAQLFEVATIGTEVVAINDDCALGNGFAACTPVQKDTAGVVIQSTAFTTTGLTPSGGTAVTASATPTNGAGRLGIAGASMLVIVAAGVTFVGAMV